MAFDTYEVMDRANRYQKRATKRTIRSREIGSWQSQLKTVRNSQAFISGVTPNLGPYNIGAGATLRQKTILTHSANPDIRLGVAPANWMFFEGLISEGTEIPHGTSVTPSDWSIVVETVPYFLRGGKGFEETDGNNIVYLWTITNNSGSAKNLYVVFQFKVISGTYGGT